MDTSIYDFGEVINRQDTNSSKWDKEVLHTMFGHEDALPFWVADMDFRTAKPIIEATMEVAEHGIYGYSKRPDSYLEAIIEWTEKRFDWKIEKEWIVYTPGVVPAINYIIQEFTKDGDKVMIQEPVYYPFKESIKKNRCQLVNNQLILEDNGDYSIDFDDFEHKLEDPDLRIFILCSPHNPIAKVWSEDDLRKIGELCLKHDVLIVSDEIHNDLVYSGNKHRMLSSISKDFEDITISCTAPSKTFNLAGMQASNIIIPNEEIRKRFEKRLELNSIGGQNPFSMKAVEAAYRYGENWLTQVLTYLEGNIDFISDFLSENLPKAKFKKPQATYLGWIDLREYMNEGETGEEFEQRIFNSKVAFDGGTWFGESGIGFIRINFACPRRLLEEGLNRLLITFK